MDKIDKVNLRRKNGKRIAILTEQEKLNLRKGKINKKVLNLLHKKLDTRIDALFTDLEIIKNSKDLQPWRARRNDKLLYMEELFQNVLMSFKPIYLNPIRRYSKRSEKKMAYFYWLDMKTISDEINERILDPQFIFRVLRSSLTDKIKEVLLKANSSGILPTNKKEAMSVLELEDKLKNREKISYLSPKTNEETKKEIAELEKPKTIMEANRSKAWDIVNNRLTLQDKEEIKKLACRIQILSRHSFVQ